MKSKILYTGLLVVLFSLFAVISCKKDMKETQNEPVPGSPFAIPPGTPVTGSVSGMVVNENNTAVEGAEVKLGINTTTTDSRGIFNFENITVDKYITTVTVSMQGYFKAYRSFSANASRNYVNIKLIPKLLSGSIDSGPGGVISLTNGTAITLQSNSLVIKSTGAAYTGSVNVFARYIDPTSSDISTIIPGSFMGSDGTNIYALQSTGMIAVDLESSSGDPLQLASNLPASLKLAIPASLLDKAPQTIDTWSLDERGVWKKEATATKNGNYYEFQATHFSFWNCDVPCNSVYVSLHMQDQHGTALANTLVQLSADLNSWWTTTNGTTDNQGNVSGMVPAGMDLRMNVFLNPFNCQGSITEQAIGPFTSNSSLTLTVTIPETNSMTLTGSATDCNGDAVQEGTVCIYTNQNFVYYTPVVNGNYTATLIHCDPIDSLVITVRDNSNGSLGSSGNIPVTGNSMIAPAITTCGTSQPAVFTIASPTGACQLGPVAGNYSAGLPLNATNTIAVAVNVISLGTYTLSTNTSDGMSFSVAGTFNNIGQQYVYLTGTGTPVGAGSATFVLYANGINGCNFNIAVNGQQAVIDLAGSPCAGISVAGNYIAGAWLDNSNTVTITANVTSPGPYHIFTDTINGFHFSDTGTVTTTGLQTFILRGNHVPNIAGTNTFTLLSSSGGTGCSFDVTTQATGPGQVDFTMIGAPGTCNGAVVNGTFTAGVATTAQNTVTVQVNVIHAGFCNTGTSVVNGLSFGGSQTYVNTGLQTMTLTTTGTPINPGVYTYGCATATGGCFFTIIVN